uniref:Fungal_trans domain-containing protein n=1 Tax=Steinernema glaseri TaxID=37863 RepID=A0A1I8AJF7_9BILA
MAHWASTEFDSSDFVDHILVKRNDDFIYGMILHATHFLRCNAFLRISAAPNTHSSGARSACSTDRTIAFYGTESPDVQHPQKANEAYPMNGTFMEWTTHLLQTAASRGDAPANAYQWKQAVVFIGETLMSQGLNPGQLSDHWFQMNQQIYHFILTRYMAIVDEAKSHRAQRPTPFFFSWYLCFASHFAKHAVSLAMTPSQYLCKERNFSRSHRSSPNQAVLSTRAARRIEDGSYTSTPAAPTASSSRRSTSRTTSTHCRIVEEAKSYRSRRPGPFFFRFFLCFASHFAKHAVSLGMSPSQYLRQAEELLKERALHVRMYSNGSYMQATLYNATPPYGYQKPWTTTPIPVEPCQPVPLIERLLGMARSQQTFEILRTATTTERREIERANDADPLNGIFLEWTTHLLQTAASRGDAPPNAYQWKQAAVFIGETLISQGIHPAHLNDHWFQVNQQLYASHYAKHAVSLGMTPSHYLCQAEELLKEPALRPKPGCIVHKGGKKNKGWLLYLDVRGTDGVFIKTLYLKDDFHPGPLRKI